MFVLLEFGGVCSQEEKAFVEGDKYSGWVWGGEKDEEIGKKHSGAGQEVKRVQEERGLA